MSRRRKDKTVDTTSEAYRARVEALQAANEKRQLPEGETTAAVRVTGAPDLIDAIKEMTPAERAAACKLWLEHNAEAE